MISALGQIFFSVTYGLKIVGIFRLQLHRLGTHESARFIY